MTDIHLTVIVPAPEAVLESAVIAGACWAAEIVPAVIAIEIAFAAAVHSD